MKLLKTLLFTTALSITTLSFAHTDLKIFGQSYRVIEQSLNQYSARPKVGSNELCDILYTAAMKSFASDREFRDTIIGLGGPDALCAMLETDPNKINSCKFVFSYYMDNCPVRD